MAYTLRIYDTFNDSFMKLTNHSEVTTVFVPRDEFYSPYKR